MSVDNQQPGLRDYIPVQHDARQPGVRFRVREGVSLVRIADPNGKLQDFYQLSGRPAILPKWAAWNPEQVTHFLSLGLIEPCDDAGTPTDPGRVIECLSACIAVGLPRGAGRPRAADLLRSSGLHYSNETIGKALKCFNTDGWKVGMEIPQ